LPLHYKIKRNLDALAFQPGRHFVLTLSWPAGRVCPTYKGSFQVRWNNNIPLFRHAAIYLEVSLFRWTSQNAFSRETAMYKWYCVQCCIAALHTISFVHGWCSIAHSIICARLIQHCTQYHLCTADTALHTVSFVHGCFTGKCILTGSME